MTCLLNVLHPVIALLLEEDQMWVNGHAVVQAVDFPL